MKKQGDSLWKWLELRIAFAGDPVAKWRFEEPAGTVLIDSSGTSMGEIAGSGVYTTRPAHDDRKPLARVDGSEL